MYRRTRCAAAILTVLCASACAKRGTGEIDVDEIQGTVDEVETHLKGMQTALQEKDLDEAADRFEEASELLQENRARLSAYPEIGLLESKVEEAQSDLCYGSVSIRLGFYFDAIRHKDVPEATDRLARTREEMERCQSRIRQRPDFVALQMNFESAPQALEDLERAIGQQVRLERAREAQGELEPRLEEVRRLLGQLEGQPDQKELARDVHAQLKAVRESLAGQREFADLPEWMAFASRMAGELDQLEARREAQVRRGKVLVTVQQLLPQASRAATRAVTTRDKQQALGLARQAFEIYKDCEDMLLASLKQEAGLAGFSFPWRSGRQNVTWLKRHCSKNRKTAEKVVRSLTGKPPPPRTPPAPAAQAAPARPDTPQAKDKKKPRRRRRIRRW